MRFKDISGQRFGHFVAQWPAGKNSGSIQWLCICDCGSLSLARGTSLRHGEHLSCGCNNGMPPELKRSRARASATLWRKANREKMQAYRDKWENANPDYKDPNKAARDRAYYQTNKENIAPVIKMWQQRNRNKSNAYKAAWRRKHPDEVLNHAQKRRANKMRSTTGHFTSQQWRELKELCGNKCLCCGKEKPLCADHVIPLSKGGSDGIENIQPLCRSCNCKKWAYHIDYRSAPRAA